MRLFLASVDGKSEFKMRSSRGSLLTIIMLTFIGVAVFGFCVVDLGAGIALSRRNYSATEAAALAAAQQMSRIVIDDPYFGYIGLSDQAPAGSALIASDGEPLPVICINTVISSARTHLIIADTLEDEYMHNLALEECAQARRAANLLQSALQESLSSNSKREFRDWQGNPIAPYAAAKKAYRANIFDVKESNAPETVDLTLTLGWDNGCGSTLSRPPAGEKYAFCSHSSLADGKYKPSTNYSYAGQDFYFAAVGSQTSLVSPSQFSKPDSVHLASIVRATTVSKLGLIARQELSTTVKNNAFAQPASTYCYHPAGSLVLDMPDGNISGFDTLSDIIAVHSETIAPVNVMSPVNGDFPGSQSTLTSLSAVGKIEKLKMRELIVLGIFDWLRTAQDRIDIASLVKVCRETSLNDSAVGERYIRFDLGANGVVNVARTAESPFASTAIHEGQLFCFAPGSLKSKGGMCTTTFVDQVHNLGSAYGGRHAGQVMPSESLNWIELPQYGGSLHWAKNLGRGLSLGLVPQGKVSMLGDGGIDIADSSFETAKHKPITKQPRKSYYSGGLAVSIQILQPI